MDFLITVHRVNVITNDQFNSQMLINIELPLKSLQFTELITLLMINLIVRC